MKKILFIHRSVGRNLIKYGNVYELLKPLSGELEFSDYDHNTKVLTTLGSHKKLGYTFPGNNTYPDNMAELFKNSSGKYSKILDWIKLYDVVIIKSCYPTTKIKSDDELAKLKNDYQQIAGFFAGTGQQLGLLTPPPMRPILTKSEWAARARELSVWMNTTSFDGNTKVLDLFDLLSIPARKRNANTLRREYRRPLFYDAHPNRKANLTIAPLFVGFIQSFL